MLHAGVQCLLNHPTIHGWGFGGGGSDCRSADWLSFVRAGGLVCCTGSQMLDGYPMSVDRPGSVKKVVECPIHGVCGVCGEP